MAKKGTDVLIWAPRGRWPGRHFLDIKPGECWPAGIPREREVLVLDDGEGVPRLLLDWLRDGSIFAAHNAAGFDAEGFDQLIARPFDVPNPAAWVDTLPLCRAAGLPGALDALGQRFLGTGKDVEGKDALKLMYTVPVRNGEPRYPVGTIPLWKKLLQYNVKDVLLLERVFDEVSSYGEPDVLDAHSAINSRGVAFDLSFLSRLQDLWAEAEQHAEAAITELTEGRLTRKALTSPVQMKEWLRKQGFRLVGVDGKETMNRQMLERLYESPEEFFIGDDDAGLSSQHAFVCEVLRLRQTVTRISKAKLQRIVDMADADGRVRDVLVAYGAHTGRWSGRGFQPHNLARGVGDLDVEGLLAQHQAGRLTLDDIRAAAARCKDQPRVDDVLSTVLRPVFCAADGCRLLIADYAAIEGRGVAWVAGEEGLLQMFHDGVDLYCDMASRIFGRPITKVDKHERQIGKITVLGCGYSMSAMKFGMFCKMQKIDLEAAGTNAEACVEAYRDAWPAIAGVLHGQFRKGGIWQQYGLAARRAIERDRPQHAGKCDFFVRGSALAIRLPSGRELTYHNARMEMQVPPYARMLGIPLDPKPTICYEHHHGYTGNLYGGLLTENIVQAICRDLLAAALVTCEADRLPVVLHVHDEIVCEVPEEAAKDGIARLTEIMSQTPAWAEGFPVAVEGFDCPRYAKSPFSGSWEVAARNGKVLSMKQKGMK